MAIFIPLRVTEKALCVKMVTEYCQNRLGGLHVEMNINEEYSLGQKNDGCEEHCVYTHVVSAQIYRSGAVVVRQGEVALKPGDNRCLLYTSYP